MTWFDDYFFGRVAAARPYLLLRGTLAVLAFDCWFTLIRRGDRYGVGDLGVPNLPIASVLPAPSPGLYIALVSLAGVLSLCSALRGPNRLVMLGAFASYAWAWGMSYLDGYQHHYLLCLLLFLFVFYPQSGLTTAELGARGAGATPEGPAPQRLGAEAGPTPTELANASDAGESKRRNEARTSGKNVGKHAKRRGKSAKPVLSLPPALSVGEHGSQPLSTARIVADAPSAWAYNLTTALLAIVYTYTGISKMEAEWRSGHVLRQLAGEKLQPLLSAGGPFHGFEDTFYWVLGHSVVVLQLVIALGYATAARRDQGSVLLARFGWVCWFCACSFHLGASWLGLRIGWFSTYMLLTACVVFLPPRTVAGLASLASWPLRNLATALGRASGAARELSVPLTLACCSATIGVGYLLDLPGGLACGSATAVWLLVASQRRGAAFDWGRAASWAATGSAASFALWLSVELGPGRHDYYQNLSRSLAWLGDQRGAKEAADKARRYARSGASTSQPDPTQED